MAKRKPYDPNIKYISERSWCTKCGTSTYFEPYREHFRGCDGWLIDIKDKGDVTKSKKPDEPREGAGTGEVQPEPDHSPAPDTGTEDTK